MKARTPDFVAIGRIEKAHGIKGDVKVKAMTDHPSRFEKLKKAIIELPGGRMEEYEISNALVRENVIYLHFRDIETREEANSLRGAFISIQGTEVIPLQADEFYHFEVVGFVVKTMPGQTLGVIDKVLDYPANSVFVVKDDKNEFLIPVIKDVVKKIDKKKGEILIDPIEGLLDLA